MQAFAQDQNTRPIGYFYQFETEIAAAFDSSLNALDDSSRAEIS